MLANILLVDDNCDSLDMLATLLKMEGYMVFTAENGHVGLQTARVEHPDLIITDLNMPEGDGLKMIREVRLQPELSGVPILAVTGYGEWNSALAIGAGANDVLEKPLDFDLLLRKLRDLLIARKTATP